MLKLKKLQILGFKSFCDRTDLRFQGEGIAAIVGPNGCGKSNISDAISWVLGEQSARLLRGVNMQDVIFAGTRERKPTGMAEVSLTLVDPEVYGDVAEPEIDVQDDMPDDWDESALRAARAEDAERYAEEVRPGQSDEEAPASAASGTAGDPTATEPCAESGAQTAPLQVVLKIRRRKFKRTFKAGEVQITRRLFRSGESEYLLNGKLCRLRDIQDIFMGTGLGPESYAIIEQGRIGQILSSKPTDRRAIIEEAAGITKFKTAQAAGGSAAGRRQAEPGAHQRYLRRSHAPDEFAEAPGVESRALCQAARRDARQAARRAGQQVRATRCRGFGARAATHRSGRRTARPGRSRAADGSRARRPHPARLCHRARVAGEPREAQHAGAGSRSRRRAPPHQRGALRRARRPLRRSAGRDRQHRRAASAFAAGAGTDRATLESANADVASAQQELQQRQQEASAAAASLVEVERQQEQRRDAILQAVSAASAVRNRITQAEERIAALDREAQRLQTRPRPPISSWKALADSAASLAWSLSRRRSA